MSCLPNSSTSISEITISQYKELANKHKIINAKLVISFKNMHAPTEYKVTEDGNSFFLMPVMEANNCFIDMRFETGDGRSYIATAPQKLSLTHDGTCNLKLVQKPDKPVAFKLI